VYIRIALPKKGSRGRVWPARCPVRDPLCLIYGHVSQDSCTIPGHGERTWCGKANEYVCSPLGMACASSGSMVITTSLTIETHYGKLYLSPGILKSDIDGGDSLDGIESLILAHYMAGVDVSSKGYIDGINTALNNLKTHSN
jgi:hypothetical protein